MLRLLLKCTSAVQPTRHEKITLCSLPSTSINELKQTIQEKFSIPSCVQVVKWEGLELKGEHRLQDYGIRSEDEITVEYCSEGDCVSVQESVQWMSTVIDEIKLKGLPKKRDGTAASRIIPQLTLDQQKIYLRTLWIERFQPWKMPKKYINKIYFIELGGLDLLMELYSLLLQNRWKDTPDELKYTEFLTLHTFWSFCETLDLRRLAIRHGVLDMFIRSLLRAKVRSGIVFRDETLESNDPDVPDLCEIVDGAIGVLCNFCELPEGQKYIGSKTYILNHILTILQNHGFYHRITLSIMEMMMQIANTSSSHSYLTQQSVVKILVGVPYCEIHLDDFEDFRYVCLSKYFALQCIARLFLVSPHKLSWLQYDSTLVNTIQINMAETLQTTTYQEIVVCEEELGPSINIHTELKILQKSCQELMALSLCIILSRKNNFEVLIKEDLLDYVICLPWHTSGSVQQRAKELVTMIQQASDVNIQPPSLLNITKATVAKYYCGLDKILQLSVPELVWELIRN